MSITLQTRRTLLFAFVLSLAACGLLGIVCLLRGRIGATESRILGTTALFGAASVVGLASAFLWDRRRWHPIGLLGVIAAPAALFTTLPLIWHNLFRGSLRFYERDLEQLSGVLWVVAVALPCIGLLAFGRLQRRYEWVRRWTGLVIAALAGVIIYAIIVDPHYPTVETLMRVGGILAIGAACGGLAVPILHQVSKIRLREAQRTVELEIDITCPRCATRQTRPVGRSACPNCRLRFLIEIEEEQCPNCGYPLHGLESAACPECGTAIATQPTT